MYGDAPYVWSQGTVTGLTTWNYNFLGSSWLVGMFGSLTNNLPRLFTHLGLSDSMSAYLANYLPVLLACLAVFHVAKRISRRTSYAYFAGLFIILNNFTLEQLIIWPGHYFWNVTGLVVLFYLLWQIHTSGFTFTRAAAIIACSLFMIHPLLWFLYILLFAVFVCFYTWSIGSVKAIVRGGVVLALIVLLNAFWIVPFTANLTAQTVGEAYHGNAESVLSGYRSIANYFNLLLFKQYPGFSGSTSQRLIYNNSQFLFTLSLYLVLGLLLLKKAMSRFAFFSLLVFLIFFNLALGPNSMITGSLWQWMYAHIPGFSFFRSFTRFLQVSLIALVVLIGVMLRDVRSKYVPWIAAAMILSMVSVNGIFLSGDLNGTVGAARIPKEYLELNAQYFSDGRSSLYTILAYPGIPYESNTWSINRATDVFPQINYFKYYFFSHPVTYNIYAVFLDQRNEKFKRVFNLTEKHHFTASFNRDIDTMNIRYVLVQKDLYNILTPDPSVSYTYYTDYLSSSPDFILREDNAYFSLYENRSYQPIITGGNIQFMKIYDTMYRIRITSVRSTVALSFHQNFDPGWRLYSKPYAVEQWCSPIKEFQEGATECRHANNFFAGSPLSGLWRKSVLDEIHTTVLDYANGWKINPDAIRSSFPPTAYHENGDGSIDLDLMLYFQPQSYFTLGIILSLFVIVGFVAITPIIIIQEHRRHIISRKRLEHGTAQ